jgi:DNA-packaging protein gp3
MARPVKYNNPEEMQILIDQYFIDCEATYGTDKPIYPAVTGLAIALDLTRTGLLEYCEKSDGFSNTIKAGKARVEHFIEQRLYSGTATGCIFNLKNNFGWKDAQDVNHGGQKDNPMKFATPDDDAIIARFIQSQQKVKPNENE